MNLYKHQKLYLSIGPIDCQIIWIEANCLQTAEMLIHCLLLSVLQSYHKWLLHGFVEDVTAVWCPFYKWCKMETLFLLHNWPATPESDQGHGPKRYLKTFFRSTMRWYIIITIRPNKCRCIFKSTMRPFTPTFTTFGRFENVFYPSFFNVWKKSIIALSSNLSFMNIVLRSWHGFYIHQTFSFFFCSS